MDLGLVGMISGAGTAAKESLAKQQEYMNTDALLRTRDEMENKRQDKMLAAQARENAAAREASATEHRETRTLTREEGAATRTASHEEGEATRQTHKDISKDTLANAKDINAATNATHLLIAKIQRDMHDKQFDKTFTQAKLSALKDTVRELGNEITRLSVVVSNPLADHADPSYKAAEIQLESATRLHNLYAKQVGLEMNIDESGIDKAITKPSLPPFKMPGSTSSAPARTPGLVQTPAPSNIEQEMMRKSLSDLK
jgi:hypothetical protein